ncbi:hypothetical protein F5878DRAFT_667772 [Lentinula raphanica]|uniref:F-box domain-containing protein n=1 Tax=Lentinula raphanica TaxID=153919 RepID=A0AA38NV93_9AGAR|nr:hypothetical protein F5878DRAFT_667772 [Lentinula raphanica]
MSSSLASVMESNFGAFSDLDGPVVDKIVAFLDIRDLINFQQTCRAANFHVTDLNRRASQDTVKLL